MYRALIVEDDRSIAKLIKEQAQMWDIDCRMVENFRDVLADFTEYQPHIVLLDIGLPIFNGYHWCSEIRKISKVPIIFISSASDNMNIVMAMNMGADDFISKPFSMLELIARIRAVLRRSQPAQSVREYRLGPLYVCPEQHIVRVDGQDVTLTNKEFELLCLLLDNQGLVLTRQVLMDRVWGFEAERENRTLDVHIRTLRVKLGAAGSLIETIRGVGYKLGSGT